MEEESAFERLSPRERALVAVAVLLDGVEAPGYLDLDRERGELLSAAAAVFATLEPDLRMPLVGTELRRALEELEGS